VTGSHVIGSFSFHVAMGKMAQNSFWKIHAVAECGRGRRSTALKRDVWIKGTWRRGRALALTARHMSAVAGAGGAFQAGW
jgi:hypothetical protein